MLSFIDTHSHITDPRYNLEEIEKHWKENNISNVFAVSYDKKSIIDVTNVAFNNNNIYAIIGVHPDDCDDYNNETEELIKSLAKNKKVLAIGEIGLDYHEIDANDFEKKNKQKEVFISQIKLADELGLPIMIHLRDACKDMLDILHDYSHYLNNGGIIHCFGESVETYDAVKKLGFVIGVGGVVTFKNGKRLQQVVEHADVRDIILETDCPYLTPEPFRGQINEPKNILYIAQKVCEIKGLTMSELSEITNKNVERVFPRFGGRNNG